jgi:hypothetical protein
MKLITSASDRVWKVETTSMGGAQCASHRSPAKADLEAPIATPHHVQRIPIPSATI